MEIEGGQAERSCSEKTGKRGRKRTTTESLSNAERDLFRTESKKLGQRNDSDEGEAERGRAKVSFE